MRKPIWSPNQRSYARTSLLSQQARWTPRHDHDYRDEREDVLIVTEGGDSGNHQRLQAREEIPAEDCTPDIAKPADDRCADSDDGKQQAHAVVDLAVIKPKEN